jgi:hypothetical protein
MRAGKSQVDHIDYPLTIWTSDPHVPIVTQTYVHSSALRPVSVRGGGRTRPSPCHCFGSRRPRVRIPPSRPTKPAGSRACYRSRERLPRSFGRHLTVELNGNRRQRPSRTEPQGHGIRAAAVLVLNRFPVLIHVGMQSHLDLSAVAGCRSLKAEADQPLHLPPFLSPCDELGQLVIRDATQFPDLQATERPRPGRWCMR